MTTRSIDRDLSLFIRGILQGGADFGTCAHAQQALEIAKLILGLAMRTPSEDVTQALHTALAVLEGGDLDALVQVRITCNSQSAIHRIRDLYRLVDPLRRSGAMAPLGEALRSSGDNAVEISRNLAEAVRIFSAADDIAARVQILGVQQRCHAELSA